MKKIILITAIATFALTSCKKDHTCVCTMTQTGFTFTYTTAAKSSKKSAENWCSALQSSTWTESGVTEPALPGASCVLL